MSELITLGRVTLHPPGGVNVHVSESVRMTDGRPCCFLTVDKGEDSGEIMGDMLSPEGAGKLIGLLQEYLQYTRDGKRKPGWKTG